MTSLLPFDPPLPASVGMPKVPVVQKDHTAGAARTADHQLVLPFGDRTLN